MRRIKLSRLLACVSSWMRTIALVEIARIVRSHNRKRNSVDRHSQILLAETEVSNLRVRINKEANRVHYGIRLIVHHEIRDGQNGPGTALSGKMKLSDVATQIQYFVVAVPRCIDVRSQAAIQTTEAYRRWTSMECIISSSSRFVLRFEEPSNLLA